MKPNKSPLRTATFALLALACLFTPAAFSQAPTAGPYAGYIAQAKQQVDQAKIQIEQIKLQQAEYRASRNEAAAKAKDIEIKRYQDLATLKQQEMTMYQQMDTIAKQPLSPNLAVAAVQGQMRQWMIEKVQLGVRQTAATQAGNTPQAAQIGQQMNALQLRITAKQQEIRLLEMKAKANQ